MFLLRHDPHFSLRCMVGGQPRPPCVPTGGFECLQRRLRRICHILINACIQFLDLAWDLTNPGSDLKFLIGK
jgi:hypothetical protein